MSFNISAWSIRQPVPTLVLFLILTILGLVAFPTLGIDVNPNIDIPEVSVTVTQLGADPQELESQVTKKIEDAVAGLGNIDYMTSKVDEGVSETDIHFVVGTNADRATNDVRNAVSQIRQNLPQDIDEPVIKRINEAGSFIISYAVVSNQRSVEQLSNLVDRTISRKLLSVPGVAQVQRLGGVDQEIRVDLNPEKLQAWGITATEVNDQIRKLNINLPGGRTNIGKSEQTVRTLGSASNVDDLKNYAIALPKGSFVPLSSLAQVSDSYAEVRQSAFLNNQPVVAFSVLRSMGSTLVTVEEGVRAAVQELEKILPPDIKLKQIFTRADFIRESYQASMETLWLGALLAVVTILVFLRDWQATLIVAVALPLSIIPTFAVLQVLGYTLNYMTLLALALVVGILVDDAIVEIENVERHVQMGKSPYQAALDASDEIGLAVVATSMTIVAVFVPVAFVGGIPGQFFQPFGMTVAGSVLFSLLVARTLTPLMAAYLLKEKKHPKTEQLHQDRFSYGYRRLLTWSLHHRMLILGLAVAFSLSSLLLVPLIPTSLLDASDLGLSVVTVELPPGSTLSQTEQVTQQVTRLLMPQPAVASVLTTAKVNSATLFVQLKPKAKRQQSQAAFEKQMRPSLGAIPGARISFASTEAVSESTKDLSIVLTSQNAAELNSVANTLLQQMRELPGLVEVTSTASLMQPQLLIKPDLNRAADLGVSVAAIARTASIATLGANEADLAKFDLPERQIPIQVALAPQFRYNLDTIKHLQVPSQNGALVPLVAVADISIGSGSAEINRYDRARQVSVDANLQGISLGTALQEIKALPVMRALPPDVEQKPFGDAKLMAEVFSKFVLALSTAVLFIYAVLVLLFGNFLHPLTIMAALPLSFGGALLGLLVTQKPLGLLAMIGIVLLMGLVTKNSILLVDYALLYRQQGKPIFRAVVESGVARLRPILMTTVAMIAGMVPIALGIGTGSEARSPMAIAVIGGLMTSTLLTLVVVPVIFTYMDAFQAKFQFLRR